MSRHINTGYRRRAEWPRNAYADWYPRPAPMASFVPVTVFTSYRPSSSPDAPYAATCACGQTHHDPQAQVLRRTMGAHSCADQLGHAPGLMPPGVDTPDEVADDDVRRILDRLRGL